MNTTNSFRPNDLLNAICNPSNPSIAETSNNPKIYKVTGPQSIGAEKIREVLNLCTLGYLNCINLEDGTRKPGASDEDYYYVMSNVPRVIEAVDGLVQHLSPIQLSRINEEAFALFNSVFGHYTPKGFDGKFAVALKEDLRERGAILVKHGITPKSAMVAEFLKEISES